MADPAEAAPQAAETGDRRSAMASKDKQSVSHRSFFVGASRRASDATEAEGDGSHSDEGRAAAVGNVVDGAANAMAAADVESQSTPPGRRPPASRRGMTFAAPSVDNLRARTRQFFAHDHGQDGQEDKGAEEPPGSDVERIVQRLEKRNEDRISVPAEVKNRFLRLCREASTNRRKSIATNEEGGIDDSFVTLDAGDKASTYILRSEVIEVRRTVRVEVESRNKFQRVLDDIKAHLGFRCHSKELLHVLNRAVDSIDDQTKGRRKSSLGQEGKGRLGSERKLGCSFTSQTGAVGIEDEDDEANWFYYKDFAFYSLKIESTYPWMRNAGVFSILMTLAFYIFTPVLWCSILKDPNICPQEGINAEAGGWLSALFFASATMSTVGYGDVTVFVGSDDIDTPLPGSWRVFVATLYMLLSLVVSVVGFQAGLDSHFSPFRRRMDIFGKRVYEILRDARIVNRSGDKHDDIHSRMWWIKFSTVAEIVLIFLILNLVGVFAVRLSLLGAKEDEFGETLSHTWMESLYWAVQTTTTIGYGDLDMPTNLRWFQLIYLVLSTYFVGSAFGKLGELSDKLESMRRLFLWQQQDASYAMLRDFSGKADRKDEGGSTGEDSAMDVEPEIDQFEFTIASLVVMGKITSEDVGPIVEKFQRLTGNKSKLSASDVSGPDRKKADPEEARSELGTVISSVSEMSSPKPSGSGAIGLGKKIAKAFREEMLSSVATEKEEPVSEEKEIVEDYAKFRIPKNTHAIAIDDSKIQRKLLAKLFSFADIPEERQTVVGDGYDEVMGFEDYVVKFMSDHDGFVFMIVDENLDIQDEDSNHLTISGSQCVENIRRRLPSEVEKRMLALIRSANDSSSDIAVYEARAHGFLPKKPIKREKVNEVLAPIWKERFPTSEFGESIAIQPSGAASSSGGDIACTPFDITQKLADIDALFEKLAHVHTPHLIHDEMHHLKGDLLTINANISVASAVGQINLIQVTNNPETLLQKWQSLRDHVNDMMFSLQKNFRLPPNVYAIAIDDSKIQRKLLAKLFSFADIPEERQTVVGETAAEIKGFEDMVIQLMHERTDDYIFMIVDENLDVLDEESKHESISGSQCVDNIRKRLPAELEKRMLALVRSANDSMNDLAIFNKRAHGFLPKAPIRREKVTETIAPIWLKRFPETEFGDSAGYSTEDEAVSVASEELACTSFDIAEKLVAIDSLFKQNAHVTDMRLIFDQLHELKGDLLTFKSDASMISTLGTINLILLSHQQTPEAVHDKWCALRDKIYGIIDSSQGEGGPGKAKRSSLLKRGKSVFSISASKA